ncbi:hypothetical protein PSTT_03006 [Puccinia striiformis]|uniref:tRNA-splicing endonuclease subunit Sen15 domain-containing protein n=1 Tax=Puccinia striiformis TaxID=27350 RepID=A0A2S4VXM7_9BASI|nr:hypothetical protein PSTT_03006 [Puccinia striiformis]
MGRMKEGSLRSVFTWDIKPGDLPMNYTCFKPTEPVVTTDSNSCFGCLWSKQNASWLEAQHRKLRIPNIVGFFWYRILAAAMSETKYPTLKEACDEVPGQAAPLLHAFADLTAAQGWQDVKVQTFPTHLSAPSRLAILRGISTASAVERIVYPMSLHQPTNFQILSNIFPSIGLGPNSKVLLAIVSSDSSIVYYELSEGIVSPKEVPE